MVGGVREDIVIMREEVVEVIGRETGIEMVIETEREIGKIRIVGT